MHGLAQVDEYPDEGCSDLIQCNSLSKSCVKDWKAKPPNFLARAFP